MAPLLLGVPCASRLSRIPKLLQHVALHPLPAAQLGPLMRLLALQTGFLAAFGGGLLSAFLLQDPKKFGISLFTDNTLGVTWTVCWWLINYCPADLVNTVHSYLPVRVVTKVHICLMTGSGHANQNLHASGCM